MSVAELSQPRLCIRMALGASKILMPWLTQANRIRMSGDGTWGSGCFKASQSESHRLVPLAAARPWALACIACEVEVVVVPASIRGHEDELRYLRKAGLAAAAPQEETIHPLS